MLLMLVKPHPPLEILNQKCPVPENYKYAWEPVVWKPISHVLKQLDETIETEIWHLTELDDDDKFLERVAELKPDIVAFSEIDVLVTQVNRLAKEIYPEMYKLCSKKSVVWEKSWAGLIITFGYKLATKILKIQRKTIFSENLMTENPENTPSVKQGSQTLIREGGRKVGSGRVATIIE